MTLYYPPTQNGLQKTLDAQLDQGHTSAVTLNNVTGVQNKPGVILINRIDTNGSEKSASLREFVSYTGTSGSTLTGLTRGLAGSTDQDHAVGSVVEFIPDVTWAQALIDTFLIAHDEAGTHKSGAVLTLPQINDTSSDHQYVFAVNELAADRTVTMPLLTGNDTFVFQAHSQTLTNKTIDGDDNTLTDIPAANLKIASQAQGDILYFNGTAWARLGAGTSGQFLKTQGAGANPTWASASNTFKKARAYKSGSTQSLNNDSATAISLDAESYDTDTFHDNSSNNSRMTIPSGGDGYYLVRGSIYYASNSTGSREAMLYKNGSPVTGTSYEAASNQQTIVAVQDILNLAATDYVELYGRQKSGGALNVSNDSTATFLELIGPF